MKWTARRGARITALVLAVAVLGACALPRSGPNIREINAGAVTQQGNAHVVPVTQQVALAAAMTPALGFAPAFQSAGIVGSDTISPGDTLGLTIWENVDQGLLAAEGVNATQLSEIQVDGAGYIFVPYAGRIRAAGNSPEALRQLITARLDTQTPDPQVSVVRLAGDGATVSVMGTVGAQGVYAIERPTRTLSSMLSRAGGVTVRPEIAQVTVKRGGVSGTVWLSDLYTDQRMDIALRPGDVILVEEDRRAFTALGATGTQARVPFETQKLTAIEAIATVGGLRTNAADPTGVFVFRDEAENVAKAVLGRPDIYGTQRMVYVLNLTEPTGIFQARDFIIRDGDTVYVTEAPFVQWQKVVGALTGTLNSAASVETLTGN